MALVDIIHQNNLFIAELLSTSEITGINFGKFKNLLYKKLLLNLANIYLFKVNKTSTRKRSEICSKLTIKTPKLVNF